MTEQHPLTDEICDELWYEHAGYFNLAEYEEARLTCRAAADWQLEQVIQFMEEHEKLFGGSGMIFILKDAMRPQQQEGNNDTP